MIGRIHKHARERLNFVGDVPVAQRLAACKAFLRLEGAMIRMRHDAGESGLSTARARAAMVDLMLAHLFDYAVASYERAHGPLPLPVALIAQGGYGRSELSPLSDIDLLFLFPSKARPALVKPVQEHLSNEILYILWDCGLKIGHAMRTVDETFAEARKDVQTKTALLESRLVAGAGALYDAFATAYRAFYLEEDPKGYIAVRLQDQAARRAKYGDTVFLQEPEIKNGVGGLRDFQNALWMARVKLGTTAIDELAAQSYLQRNEARDFQRAYDFLLRVRNELHFQSKRPTDVLTLDIQPRIALGLGYTHHDMLGRVEQFMRDYYRAAQTIHRVAKLIENRLALTLETPDKNRISFRDLIRARKLERTKRIDGFILRGSELAPETNDVFRSDPARLVRVFRHCQQLGAQPDFALQGLIRESLPLLTRQVQRSPDACISFRAILEEAGAVFPTLSLMHELGVLGRFIPEFDALTCLVQHEFYHRYTADIHTLHAIRELDQIFTDEPEVPGHAARDRLAHAALPHPAAARHRQGARHQGPRRERRGDRRAHPGTPWRRPVEPRGRQLHHPAAPANDALLAEARRRRSGDRRCVRRGGDRRRAPALPLRPHLLRRPRHRRRSLEQLQGHAPYAALPGDARVLCPRRRARHAPVGAAPAHARRTPRPRHPRRRRRRDPGAL
jgi:[protein-PII] uridylyltransferase